MPSLAQPPLRIKRKGLVTLTFKICTVLQKTGNTNQIVLLVITNFSDVCFGDTIDTRELHNVWKTVL